ETGDLVGVAAVDHDRARGDRAGPGDDVGVAGVDATVGPQQTANGQDPRDVGVGRGQVDHTIGAGGTEVDRPARAIGIDVGAATGSVRVDVVRQGLDGVGAAGENAVVGTEHGQITVD